MGSVSTLDEYFTWTSALINGAQGLVNPVLEEMGVPAPEGSAFEHAARKPMAVLGLQPRWDTGDYPGGTLSWPKDHFETAVARVDMGWKDEEHPLVATPSYAKYAKEAYDFVMDKAMPAMAAAQATFSSYEEMIAYGSVTNDSTYFSALVSPSGGGLLHGREGGTPLSVGTRGNGTRRGDGKGKRKVCHEVDTPRARVRRCCGCVVTAPFFCPSGSDLAFYKLGMRFCVQCVRLRQAEACSNVCVYVCVMSVCTTLYLTLGNAPFLLPPVPRGCSAQHRGVAVRKSRTARSASYLEATSQADSMEIDGFPRSGLEAGGVSLEEAGMHGGLLARSGAPRAMSAERAISCGQSLQFPANIPCNFLRKFAAISCGNSLQFPAEIRCNFLRKFAAI